MKQLLGLLAAACFSLSSTAAFGSQCDAHHWCPPYNFKLSDGPSQAITGFEDQPQEFYYWSINSFHEGIFALGWPDNSDVPDTNVPNQLNLVARSGKAKENKKHHSCEGLKAKLNSSVKVIQALPDQFAGNFSTVVNPTCRDNVVLFGTFRDRNLPADGPDQRQLWRAVSYDGGKTFPLVGRIFNLTDLIVDTFAIADKFGNIWISYVTGPLSDPNAYPRTLIIAVSSDKGESFTQVAQLIPPANYPVGYDLPTLACGGDGKGGYGLWFAPTIIDNETVSPTLGFIPVSGLGLYNTGAMQTVIFSSLGSFDWEPSISVTKDGRVFLASVQSDENTQAGNDGVKFLAKLDGTNNFVDGNYQGPTIIQNRYIGAYMNPPFLPNGTFLTVSPNAIAFDEHHQILHVLFVDLLGPCSPDYGVYLISSNDNGESWTERVLVSDCTQGPRGLHASLALDSANKGDAFISWWDARNDSCARTVEMFGAVIPHCFLKHQFDDNFHAQNKKKK